VDEDDREVGDSRQSASFTLANASASGLESFTKLLMLLTTDALMAFARALALEPAYAKEGQDRALVVVNGSLVLGSQVHVARPGRFFEIQYGLATFELPQHRRYAIFDRRVIGAVAGDEFLDD
jgi:hypothetical protein